MNKAKPLYDAFMKAISTRDGCKIHAKQCVEVFIRECEKLVTEFEDHTPEWWAYRFEEIREDMEEL